MPTHVDSMPRVVKRNETVEEFDVDKIRKGILLSANEVGLDINGKFDDLIGAITAEAASSTSNDLISTEDMTGIVKRNLMDFQYHEVAEAFILYADRQAKSRLSPDTTLMSDYIVMTRYARYNQDLKRREVYSEAVDRVKNMHLRRYPQIAKELEWAFEKVYAKEVLGSMRAMQFGGPAMEVNHAKGYNCSFSVCNRPRVFAEAFWLLLSGAGVGFSIQFQHVDQLPDVKFVEQKNVNHVVIGDTIEGWANAANALVESYLKNGVYVEFAYNKIRPQGSILKTSGGKAPGHLPLKKALENVRSVFEHAKGRQLKPIECYDIMCQLADAVYAGGIREAAMIALFSLDDGEMMNAKTGDWLSEFPWRSRCNNSVVLHRKDIKKRQYDRIFKATKQWGEPGFYFTDDEDTGANPCVEIGLNPKLTITPEIKMGLVKWAQKTGREILKLRVNKVYWGWQMCNLTEVNAATVSSPEELYERVKAAAIIGTAQAGYTDFEYLGWVSEAICNREALLGVSITGMMDSPNIALNPEVQRTAAQIAVETNIEIAQRIGIRSAARVTCVKPSGTASIVLGGVANGIHTHHAKRYFRRVRANPDCNIYKHFKELNGHMCMSVNERKDLITFPIKAPSGALTRHDLTAIEFLYKVLSTQKNWVLPGVAKPSSSQGVTHNVSNTITIKEHEWDEIREFLWANRQFFSGVSMLSDVGDKVYVNAPKEEIHTESDESKWQDLIKHRQEIDWSKFGEEDDNTDLRSEKACAGGACSI